VESATEGYTFVTGRISCVLRAFWLAFITPWLAACYLPTKFELLRTIYSANKQLDMGAAITLATRKDCMSALEQFRIIRMRLIKLQRIRKGQGHSQRIKTLISLSKIS